MRKRNIIIAFMLAIIVFATFSSAAQLICLKRGEKLKFSECNPAMHDYTCTSSTCQICTTLSTQGKFCPSSLNFCNNQDQQCQSLGNTTIDQTPPVLTITNPVESQVYNSAAIPIILGTDEDAAIAYQDMIYGNGRWNVICNHCYSYENKRSFKEGPNQISFRATDFNSNSIYRNVSFFIDSKKPKITKTAPRKKGFTSGSFEIEFKEANPVSLILHYGDNDSGFRQKTVDITNECSTLTGGRTFCDPSAVLTDFDGEIITYWFQLTDMANSEAISKPTDINVDTTFPVINYLTAALAGRTALFNVSITEANLDSIEYLDNSELRPRLKSLCSSLRNNACTRRITFRSGEHDIDVQLTDKAGNSISQSLNLIIP